MESVILVATSRADMVLEQVLQYLPTSPIPEARQAVILQHWTESEDRFCIVYCLPGQDVGKVGLRRLVEADVPINEIVEEIVDLEIGEPKANFYRRLKPDGEGVRWWQGNPPSERSYNWGKRCGSLLAALGASLRRCYFASSDQ